MDRLGSETCPGVKRSPLSQDLRFLSTGSNLIFPPACLMDTDRRQYRRSGGNCVALICSFLDKNHSIIHASEDTGRTLDNELQASTLKHTHRHRQ